MHCAEFWKDHTKIKGIEPEYSLRPKVESNNVI